MNKKAIEMGFNWIFALIIGAAILALAIYGTTRFISTSEESLYTESAAKLISLLDPFETGLASGKSSQINFQKLTRTYYECDEFSSQPFGRQTIAFSEQTLGDTWGDQGGAVTIKNKYVFAEDIVEGKNLYVFSKPFFMSFKVADLIMISSDEYCFYNAPEDIEKEIKGLNIANIEFVNSLENCTDKINVCWGSADCEIKVTENRVIKNNQQLYYTDDLIYAAIFSSVENYNCNLKRLKSKFNELSLVYSDKINVIQQYGCGTGIKTSLEVVRNQKIESSKDFLGLRVNINKLDSANLAASSGCKLW